jgi:uncharacterized protein (TIGR02118 family)
MPMHKLIVLYKNPPDPAAFRAHYEASHLPLVRRVPGVVEASVSFDVGDGAGGTAAYAAVGETLFVDKAAMLGCFATREGQALIADAAAYEGTEFELIDFPVVA